MSTVNSNPRRPLISRKKSELQKSFQSAKSLDKQIKVLKEMEKVFKESELGYECWHLASHLLEQDRSPEQVLFFGNRALRIFITHDNNSTHCLGNSGCTIGIGSGATPCYRNHKSSLYIAYICTLLASASTKLKRYNESLSYLKWADRNLSKLDDESSCASNCFLKTSVVTQRELFLVKVEMGRIDEAVIHLRETTRNLERVMEEGCVKLGESYEFLFGFDFRLMNYEEALPYGLKALEVFTKHFGSKSVKVLSLMRNLAVVYIELGDYENALEQNQQSRGILKKKAPDGHDWLDVESDHGEILIGLGKYEEAIDVLRRVVSHANTKGETRASAFLTMARAFCCLGKLSDAEKYMKTALTSGEMEQEINVAARFRNMCNMSRLYAKNGGFDFATYLLGTALIISCLPRKILMEGSATLLSLISLSDHKEEGLPYMERVVKKIEESEAEDFEVAHSYRNLGVVYLRSGREELAMKFMKKAKDIMDVAFGPNHLDSLRTSHALAETYATIKRYDLAIEMQMKVVEGLKVLEPREQEFLDVAVKLLNKMMGRASESSTRASPLYDLSADISKCGI